jgi:hypothetical protein
MTINLKVPPPSENWVDNDWIDMYLVIAVDRSTDTTPVFWKANRRGYTTCMAVAGTYHRNLIELQPYIYNDGVSTIAIPLTTDALTALGMETVWKYGEDFLRPFMNTDAD